MIFFLKYISEHFTCPFTMYNCSTTLFYLTWLQQIYGHLTLHLCRAIKVIYCTYSSPLKCIIYHFPYMFNILFPFKPHNNQAAWGQLCRRCCLVQELISADHDPDPHLNIGHWPDYMIRIKYYAHTPRFAEQRFKNLIFYGNILKSPHRVLGAVKILHDHFGFLLWPLSRR